MYNHLNTKRKLRQLSTLCFGLLVSLGTTLNANAQTYQLPTNVVQTISKQNTKLELTENSSRILTLGKKIPRVQVNNPDLLTATPLSATQIQIAAKKAGVTQINLWDEDGNIHTVDIIIYGDVRELEMALATQFPNSAIKVYRYSNSLVLKGYVDRADYVEQIRSLAEDYAPKVINNITVGGVQQILLKTTIAEVSRTKFRNLGVDWAQLSGGAFIGTSISGIITNGGVITNLNAAGRTVVDAASGKTFSFGVIDGGDTFTAAIKVLQQNDIAKILAEPQLTAVSGRPAHFNSGGEIPIAIPQGLGSVAIEFKPFGTQIDFLPIVLGNGKIRLEVRARISELDSALGIVLSGQTIPGLKVHTVDTAVEMRAGQTFALAGLFQQRTDAQHRGIPFLSDIPILGIPFREVKSTVEEVELLILVTPELVDPLEPHQVPTCLPGMSSQVPSNGQLYLGGHIEIQPKRSAPACTPATGCATGSQEAGGLIGVPVYQEGYPGVPTPAAANQPSINQRLKAQPVSLSTPTPTNPDVRPNPYKKNRAIPNKFIGPIGYGIKK